MIIVGRKCEIKIFLNRLLLIINLENFNYKMIKEDKKDRVRKRVKSERERERKSEKFGPRQQV